MRYAILADIHANLEALQAVLADAKAMRCTQYACLGDTVGFNANPKECLEIVRKLEMPCVKGDHDEYCSGETNLDQFHPHMAKVIQWTRAQLTGDDRKWLRELPCVRAVASFSIVHATLDNPESWGYVFDRYAAAASFNAQKSSVCFFGHTHVPGAFVRDDMVRGGACDKLKIEPDRQYFVNPGSVGQPRDGNPKALYAVYDLEERSIEVRRLDYDIATAQKKVVAAGLHRKNDGN